MVSVSRNPTESRAITTKHWFKPHVTERAKCAMLNVQNNSF